MLSKARVCILLLSAALPVAATHAVSPKPAEKASWAITRPATNFDRSALTDPAFARRIRVGGSLGGGTSDWGITGQVEYDVEVPASGWYELSVEGSAAETGFSFDPDESGLAGYAFYGGTGLVGEREKIGNAWLAEGKHRLRVQRYYWTGFPKLRSFTLRASPPTAAKSTYVSLDVGASIYRIGKCPLLEVRSGGQTNALRLTVLAKDTSGKTLRTETVDFPAGSPSRNRKVSIPCDREGTFTVVFADGGGDISWRELRPITYEVIDTSAKSYSSRLRKTLVQEIDLVVTPPDYFAGGASRITHSAAGTYRESGDTGFTRYQRTAEPARRLLPDPSWFAYRLSGLIAQRTHVVEIDYPDDRLRTFAIALRESSPLSYPVAGAVDSGGEFSLTQRTHTHSLLYWPRAEGTRVTFLNAHDGRRAAASRIRVYRLDGVLPPLLPEGSAGRHFLNWYEEGSNFLSMYGAPDEWRSGPKIATERWAEGVRHAGGTVLAPTVAVYSFALYPSRYNLAFSKSDVDYLRRTLLVAEKHNLKVLPELHPRADELSWPFAASPDPKPHLLVSREGRTSGSLPPLFNPLFPANQDWYVGMIGELADNYRDSPALLGINLRLMQWANPALNNFHSLDWGYDDYTVGLFKRETGSAVPMGGAGEPSRFGARYTWLMANAREQWVAWRCAKIASLYERIRDRVRSARPDLQVFSSVFQWEAISHQSLALREAGIDPALLNAIDGLQLINATHAYGRKEPDMLVTQRARDALLDPTELTLIAGGTGQGRFLSGANYIEATEAIVPPPLLGFDPKTKLNWMSATANPAGRHHLERFAIQLAETDADMLGDGGNAYSLGQPELREFLAEFLRLPPEPFSPRIDARDPVAVWERTTPDALIFYAVNRERYPITVTFQFSPGAKLTRLSDASTVRLENSKLRVELAPYQLRAFRASARSRIVRIDSEVPTSDRARVNAQVRWIESIAQAQDGKWFSRLDRAEQALLADSASEAAAALRRGHLWRTRTLLEHHRLLDVYRKLQQPPQLRDESRPSQ